MTKVKRFKYLAVVSRRVPGSIKKGRNRGLFPCADCQCEAPVGMAGSGPWVRL